MKPFQTVFIVSVGLSSQWGGVCFSIFGPTLKSIFYYLTVCFSFVESGSYYRLGVFLFDLIRRYICWRFLFWRGMGALECVFWFYNYFLDSDTDWQLGNNTDWFDKGPCVHDWAIFWYIWNFFLAIIFVRWVCIWFGFCFGWFIVVYIFLNFFCKIFQSGYQSTWNESVAKCTRNPENTDRGRSCSPWIVYCKSGV